MRQVATIIAGCALAATAACGGNNDSAAGANRDTNESSTEARETRPSQPSEQPLTLTGCLQKRGGGISNEYLLTMINEPAGVGTSGSVTATGSSVEREQMRIAARTFRLDPKNDVDLNPMLGKQVRVTGRIDEPADVPNGKGPIGSDLDTQRPNRDPVAQERRGAGLKVDDLALFDVTSAAVVADACGDNRSGQAGETGASPQGPETLPGPGNVHRELPQGAPSEQGPRRPIQR